MKFSNVQWRSLSKSSAWNPIFENFVPCKQLLNNSQSYFFQKKPQKYYYIRSEEKLKPVCDVKTLNQIKSDLSMKSDFYGSEKNMDR